MLGGSIRIAAVLAVAALLALGVAACGGDDTSTTSTVSPPVTTQTRPDDRGGQAPKAGGKHDGGKAGDASKQSNGGNASKPSGPADGAQQTNSGGGSDQFRRPGGDNSIQEFGEEASDSDRAEAAEVLHAYLTAQSNQNWEGMCSYLSQRMHEQLRDLASGSPELRGKGCAPTAAALLSGAPPAVRAELAEADVGSLRIEGEKAFILYHGAKNVDYAILLVKEGDAWKVDALAATAFP